MFKMSLFICLSVLIAVHGLSQDWPAGINPETGLILPKPGGKFAVSRYWTSLKDETRNGREVPVFIYYPVNSSGAVNFIFPTTEWQQHYLPSLKKRLGDKAGEALAFGKASFSDNLPFTGKEKLPLVFFAPGMGWSSPEYSFIIQELVSEGYIVIAVNSSTVSPVLQSPSGNFLTATDTADRYQLVADDILFVLKQVKAQNGRLHQVFKYADFDNIAMLGHSLGGAAALLAANNHPGIKAAVNMDGDMMAASMKAAPTASVLFLNQLPAGFEKKSFDEMKSGSSANGWRYQQMNKSAANARNGMYIAIEGMRHSNFQDYALLPVDWIPQDIRKSRLGPIDGSNCLYLITKVLTTYLDNILKGKNDEWTKLEEENPGLRKFLLLPSK
jgi:predicted dienelactone hydrolase